MDYGIKRLFQRGVFSTYAKHYNKEIKPFLKKSIEAYERLKELDKVKLQYITSLEKADDFFVHKLSFEKVCTLLPW